MYTLLHLFWYAFLVMRTTGKPARTASMAREQVTALNRGVPVYQIAAMDQLLSRSVAANRFDLFLLVLFGMLALGLAAVGRLASAGAHTSAHDPKANPASRRANVFRKLHDGYLAPQPEFVTEIMHSPRPSPSTGEGTRQRAQRRE
jgi:hypothetical protein